MSLFTIIADHEDGGSSFSQVRAESVAQALTSWVESLEGASWEHFTEAHCEQILDQMDQDALQEEVAWKINDCRFLWQQDYLLHPEEKLLRVLIVKTAEE